MKKWSDHRKKKGHTVNKCYKLLRYPEWFGNAGKGKTNGGNMTYVANVGRKNVMGCGSENGKEVNT